MMRVMAILMFAPLVSATPIEEPATEMVTIPKSELFKLMEEYKQQRAANILLFERQEEVNKRLDNFHNGTGCT
jgi:hypothetical protein